MSEPIRPHAKNAPGPFYVVDGCCTACGVPFVEAPGMFAEDDEKHCYVSHQPQDKNELYRMLRAIRAAELQCIRYGGNDREVLRRLGEIGEPDVCDVQPPADIEPVFRNHVTFDAASRGVELMTPRELALALQEYLQPREDLDSPLDVDKVNELLSAIGERWPLFEFTPIVANAESAAFSYSWFQRNFHPIEFRVVSLPGCRWLLRHSPVEKPGSRSLSMSLDEWLKSDARFSNVRWYSAEQWNGSKEWQETPW